MKTETCILATSHVDAHGDKLTQEELICLADQINTSYIPMGTEHDPRIPPHARLISARVELLEDEEMALIGVREVFESGECVPFFDNGREAPLAGELNTPIHVVFDSSYDDTTSWAIIEEMSKLLKSEPQKDVKKSVAALSIIGIAGGFVLGEIASGFLKKFGSDGADALKAYIRQLLAGRTPSEDKMLSIKAFVEYEGRVIEAELIVTNPTPEEINFLFSQGLEQFDRIIKVAIKNHPNARKLLYQLENGNITFSYAVRRDAVAILPIN